MKEEKGIFSSIIAVMDEIGAIKKGKVNSQQGFRYRGIDDVLNALNPIISKHGIFIVPEVLDMQCEERSAKNGGALLRVMLKIKFTFFAKDGSNINATVIGEAIDGGDKAANKAMSVAFKYACFQVFCIPTDEMKDPDAETHEIVPKEQSGLNIILNEVFNCASVDDLRGLWERNVALQKNVAFIKAVNQRKIEFARAKNGGRGNE